MQCTVINVNALHSTVKLSHASVLCCTKVREGSCQSDEFTVVPTLGRKFLNYKKVVADSLESWKIFVVVHIAPKTISQ